MTDSTTASHNSQDGSVTGRTSLDVAVLLTLGGLVLYSLGSFYWAAYLKYFGLSLDLVGLTFEQVLSKTWPIAFLFFLPFAFSWATSVQHISDRRHLSVASFVAYTVLGITGIATSHLQLAGWSLAFVLAGLPVLAGLLVFPFRHRTVSLSSLFPAAPEWQVVIVAACLLVGFVLFGLLGRLDAHQASRSSAAKCLTGLVPAVREDSARFLFLTRSSDYIVLVPFDSGAAGTTGLVLNAAALTAARVVPCNR